MPTNSNSTGNLAISTLSLSSLNDRLRRIGNALNSLTGNTKTSATTTTDADGVAQIVLTVPGVLAVQSDVAPILELATAQSFSQILAFVKSAPIGSPLTVQLYVGGVSWGPALTIAAGSTSASVSLSSTSTITANTIIRLDITAVGALLTGISYPGSDLTVLVR